MSKGRHEARWTLRGRVFSTIKTTKSTATRTTKRRTIRARVLAPSLLAAVGLLLFVGALAAFAAPPPQYAADLDQCRNGGIADPQTSVQCTGPGNGNDGWVNGNAGASNSHYAEGESISYRARLTGFTAGDDVTIVLGYDVIHGGHYAIDYLTDKNGWQDPETTVGATPDDPTSGVSGVSTTPVTVAIPTPPGSVNADPSLSSTAGCIDGTTGQLQPETSFLAQPASERVMEFFGVTGTPTISYVGPVPDFTDTSGGDIEQQISLTFTAAGSNVVIAWGGHIGSRLDWGCADGPLSAGGISGSPYHMRLKTFSVNGENEGLGNQDRSLSAAAITVPADVELTKTPNPSTICTGLSTSVTYTYVVSNPGAIAISGTVVDDNGTPADATDDITVGTFTNLAPGGSQTFTQTMTLNASRTNTATATATSSQGASDTDTATATVTAVSCDIEVAKSASPTTICSGVNTTVTFSYTVSNPGGVALTGVTVSDNQVAGAQAAFEAANGSSDTLAAGASVSFTLSATAGSPGTVTNTVTASGNALGQTPADTDTASATVTIVDCAGNIFHTGTTCEQFHLGAPPSGLAGTELSTVNYSVKANKINSANPGVFFYYTSFTAPSDTFTVDIVQSIAAGEGYSTFFGIHQGGPGEFEVRIFNDDCSNYTGGATITNGNGQATIVFNQSGITGDTFVISVKYDKDAHIGQAQPPNLLANGRDVQYNWATEVNDVVIDSDPDGLLFHKTN